MWIYATESEPEWTCVDLTDRELAARICEGCSVRLACLELELRTAGMNTLGVWGALSETDRKALYPLWLARRGRSGSGDGGDTP
jgi:WhiB family redox-sensing transcriptional regulator